MCVFKSLSRVRLFVTQRTTSCQAPDSPGKNTGVGCHALLQGIFLAPGSNPGLLHYRQILYHPSHWGGLTVLRKYKMRDFAVASLFISNNWLYYYTNKGGNIRWLMTYSDGSVVKNLLPTQKTRVQSQIQEDSTCHSATKPVCCNC